MLLVVNGAPIVVNTLMGKHLARPVDNGFMLPDRQRLFGSSKTWRGLCAALLSSMGAALLFGLDALTGAQFGALTMAGDLLASFLKRRCGYRESSHARGLDTVPETLLPVWLLDDSLNLGAIEIALTVGLFFLIEEFISPILYRLHIRKRPY